MRKLIFSLLGIAMLVGAYFLLATSDEEPLQDGLDVIKTSDGKIFIGDLNVMSAPQPSSDVSWSEPSESRCDNLERLVEQASRMFGQAIDADTLLSEGNSIDDVTLLIQAMKNENFAREWRDVKRKEAAKLSQLDKSLNEQFQALLSDKLRASGLSVVTKIPSPWLKQAIEANQPFTKYQDKEVSPEDIAWLIGQENIDDSRLKEAFALMSEPEAMLSSNVQLMEFRQATNILDAAAMKGRPALAEWLLNQGVSPVEDAYLGGTLDFALRGLQGMFSISWPVEEDKPEIVSESVPQQTIAAQLALIQRLQGLGLELHGEYYVGKSTKTLNSYFAVNLFYIERVAIDYIEQQYGVNLLSIPQAPPLSSATSEDIIASYKQAKAEEITKVAGQDYETQLASCKQFRERIAIKWKPETLHTADFQDSTQDELFTKAPELVSCQREMLQRRHRSRFRADGDIDIYPIVRLISKKDYEAAFALVAENPSVTDEVVYDMLDRAYQPMLNAGLIPTELDYSYRFSLRFAKLAEQGFDLQQPDKYGRSLLYVAASQWSPEQMEYLVEQRVPYYHLPDAPDPLYLVLYYIATRNKQDYQQMLEAVMSYDPPITPMHLSQMQVLKLRSPEVYAAIEAQFPQLGVEGADTEYPSYTCYLD
ncbi:hypothetical protein [Alteromonas confluentis]|nr:hypothetical protein [Alteromonas confluentis]